jgi:hypothetical protein
MQRRHLLLSTLALASLWARPGKAASIDATLIGVEFITIDAWNSTAEDWLSGKFLADKFSGKLVAAANDAFAAKGRNIPVGNPFDAENLPASVPFDKWLQVALRIDLAHDPSSYVRTSRPRRRRHDLHPELRQFPVPHADHPLQDNRRCGAARGGCHESRNRPDDPLRHRAHQRHQIAGGS